MSLIGWALDCIPPAASKLGVGDSVSKKPEQRRPNDATYCLKVEDFYRPQARRMVGMLAHHILEGAGITAFDLIYSPAYQRQLMDAGRGIDDAIHRGATMQAEKAGTNSRTRAKELRALIGGAIKVSREKGKTVPTFDTPEEYGKVAETILASEKERRRDHPKYVDCATFAPRQEVGRPGSLARRHP